MTWDKFKVPLSFQLVTDAQLTKIISVWRKHISLIISLALEVQEYRRVYGPLGCSHLTIEEG